jgi:predicted transcriptional regulator
MFSPILTKLIRKEQGHFLVPADKIAFVNEDNPLYHAFLILTKVRYAKIPVLDDDQRVVGLISLAMITNKMLTPGDIVIAPLSALKVKDVMQTAFPKINLAQASFEDQLNILIDNNFVVAVDEADVFQGLVTRREWMKTLNYLGHTLDDNYLQSYLAQQKGKA